MDGELTDQTLRVPIVGRAMATAVTAGWFALAAAETAYAQASVAVLVLLWAGYVALALGTWRWAFVPRITLTSAGVDITNRLRRARVPYADIATVQIAYNGITMMTHAGARVTAWAIQKSTIAKLAGRRTHGDDVVAAILSRATAACAATS